MPLDRLLGEESPSNQVLNPLLDRQVPEVESVVTPEVREVTAPDLAAPDLAGKDKA